MDSNSGKPEKPEKKGKALNAYKKTITLSTRQHEILKGSLLGDLHITKEYTGNFSRLAFEQGDLNNAYLFHLYNEFEAWVLTPPRKRVVINKKGATSISWVFQTFSHSEFQFYHDLVYVNKDKRLTLENIRYLLSSPIALAYWFMDDGSNGISGYDLWTGDFSIDENELLRQVLKENFGLETTLGQKNSTHGNRHLYIRAQSRILFRSLVEPYILPSMRYKLIDEKMK